MKTTRLSTLLALVVSPLLLGPYCFGQDKELSDLAMSLTSQIRMRGKGPVAIVPFSDGSYCPAFSNYVGDRLGILMVKGNTDFDVVLRQRTEEVIREINLSLGKYYDASTFARVGKMVGARSLIMGHYTVQPAAASVSLAVQIVDVETLRIIGGDIAELRYTGDIKNMLDPQGCINAGPASDPSSTANQPLQRPRAYETKRVRELQIAFDGCKVVSTGLRCDVLVTNLGAPERYCIYDDDHGAKTRAIDDGGSVFTVSALRFGDDSNRWDACASLPTSVGVKSSVLFQEIRSESGRLALLEFVFDFPPHPAIPMPAGSRSIETSVTVAFHNVAIEH